MLLASAIQIPSVNCGLSVNPIHICGLNEKAFCLVKDPQSLVAINAQYAAYRQRDESIALEMENFLFVMQRAIYAANCAQIYVSRTQA